MALDFDILLRKDDFSDDFIESLPGMFFMYNLESSRLVKWNTQHSTLTGYTNEDLAQKMIFDWFRAEDKAKVSGALAICLDEGMNSLEIDIVRKDGSPLPCLLTATKKNFGSSGYLVGLGMEIGAADRERRIFREFFEKSRSPICVIDGDGSIVTANPRLLRLFGTERGDIIGRSIFDFSIREGAKDFALALRRVGDGSFQSYSFETVVRRANGQPVLVEVSVVLLHSRDSSPMIACTLNEDTESALARMELKRALEEKTNLIHEIRHRIGNNIQILASLMRLTKRRYAEGDDFSEAVLGRVETMALIYLNMIETHGIADLKLADFVAELTANIQTAYGGNGGSVVIETQLPRSYSMDSDKVLTLGLLISEMIRAFLEVGGPYTQERLRVSAEKRDQTLRLEIVSASRKLPAAYYDHESDEALLIVVLTDQLRGTLDVRKSADERWTGTCFEIVIPDSSGQATPLLPAKNSSVSN